jgi:hypothetical protein
MQMLSGNTIKDSNSFSVIGTSRTIFSSNNNDFLQRPTKWLTGSGGATNTHLHSTPLFTECVPSAAEPVLGGVLQLPIHR